VKGETKIADRNFSDKDATLARKRVRGREKSKSMPKITVGENAPKSRQALPALPGEDEARSSRRDS